MKNWISAFRLRTLPLALSSILMGSFLAAFYDSFDLVITLFCILTTIFLQVLSNLANDYGDFINGADNEERIGPERAMQSGSISKEQMKKAIIIFVVLSLLSGITLLVFSFGVSNLPLIGLFLLIGLGSIWAALNYTAGKNPYGYKGMGDLFVFIFFGLVGVIGTFYLQTNTLNFLILLPASASGLLAVGVLNINNTRDLIPDEKAGKITIPVMIGAKAARVYQLFLINSPFILLTLFLTLSISTLYKLNYLFFLSYPLLLMIGVKVYKKKDEELDPLLKTMALSSLLLTLLFGLGINL